MQGYANITIKGKTYGILVRPKKYARALKLAKSPFANPNTDVSDEIKAIENTPHLDALLSGEQIEV